MWLETSGGGETGEPELLASASNDEIASEILARVWVRVSKIQFLVPSHTPVPTPYSICDCSAQEPRSLLGIILKGNFKVLSLYYFYSLSKEEESHAAEWQGWSG